MGNNLETRMVRLFVSDIDGCLSEPYRPFRRDRIHELAAMSAGITVANQVGAAPALSICSGRSYPYVEAMTQLLHLQTPVVFEAGGGMFDPVSARWFWHPDYTDDLDRQIREMRSWLTTDISPGTAMDLDHAKKTQASLAGPIADEVFAAVPLVEQRASEQYPDLLVAHTHISIDVIPRTLNKANGMRWLANELSVELEEIAFIGDTNGDLPALEIVGYPFAPANATDSVKEAARISTDGSVIDGVLEAYAWCTGHNERLLSESQIET